MQLLGGMRIRGGGKMFLLRGGRIDLLGDAPSRDSWGHEQDIYERKSKKNFEMAAQHGFYWNFEEDDYASYELGTWKPKPKIWRCYRDLRRRQRCRTRQPFRGVVTAKGRKGRRVNARDGARLIKDHMGSTPWAWSYLQGRPMRQALTAAVRLAAWEEHCASWTDEERVTRHRLCTLAQGCDACQKALQVRWVQMAPFVSTVLRMILAERLRKRVLGKGESIPRLRRLDGRLTAGGRRWKRVHAMLGWRPLPDRIHCARPSSSTERVSEDDPQGWMDFMCRWFTDQYWVREVWLNYEERVLIPLWCARLKRRKEDCLRQLRILAALLGRVLAQCLAGEAATALALRERKLLCPSRGGLANEQHFLSLCVAQRSMWEGLASPWFFLATPFPYGARVLCNSQTTVSVTCNSRRLWRPLILSSGGVPPALPLTPLHIHLDSV